MSVFPKLGKINDVVFNTINSRAGNNREVSKLTSWIRVASAVENKHGTGLILETIPSEQTFAQTYGTSNRSGRVGKTFDNKEVFAPNDRGYRPSPVIESVSIENGHQGLSRKAKFTVKCFTLAQAEIVTQYFYQPGFVVLLEYGWNTTQSMETRADLSTNGACEIARYNNYSYITKKREESGGTYDGFMGRITGGGYQSGDDETYTVDVELTTLGEIPTYLQAHKSGIVDSDDGELNSSLRYTVSEIEGAAESANTIGLALFQQVYNELPNEKRSLRVKGLSADAPFGWDVNSIPYINERNFINVDESVRELLVKKFTSSFFGLLGGGEIDGASATIPDGATLISDQSYIRLELAFRILNEYSVNLERTTAKNSPCGDNVKSYSYIINTNDTIIGAHKWMFSIDGSKLFIPNTNHPNFGLENAFSSEAEVKQIIRPAGLGEATNEDMVVDLNPWKGSGVDDKYAFPSTQPLEADKTDKDIIPQTAEAGQWGYLRNLYINLDFFIQVMSRTNFVMKDILFELLNGISAAAGSQWQFDLAEVPHESRTSGQFSSFDYEIKVVDHNFIGGKDLGDDSVHKFKSKGIESPFLTSNLNMPIPASMRNQILGKYNSAVKITTITEGSDDKFDAFFSRKLDPVSEILNSFKESEAGTPTEGKQGKPTADEIQKANFEIFMGKATVVPIKQDRKEEFTSELKQHLMVVAWEDSKLLKQVAKKFGRKMGSQSNKTISQILSIDFTFEIHGVSGLKVGDVFQIVDLPSQFKDGVFQIMEQSHDLSGGLWKTTITAKMRNFTI